MQVTGSVLEAPRRVEVRALEATKPCSKPLLSRTKNLVEFKQIREMLKKMFFFFFFTFSRFSSLDYILRFLFRNFLEGTLQVYEALSNIKFFLLHLNLRNINVSEIQNILNIKISMFC